MTASECKTGQRTFLMSCILTHDRCHLPKIKDEKNLFISARKKVLIVGAEVKLSEVLDSSDATRVPRRVLISA